MENCLAHSDYKMMINITQNNKKERDSLSRQTHASRRENLWETMCQEAP